jgi:hypothetical protein
MKTVGTKETNMELVPQWPQSPCMDSGYDPSRPTIGGLSGYIRHTWNVLEENDIVLPDDSRIVQIVTAALDARALLVAVSIRYPEIDRLQTLFDDLILFCTEPPIEAEGAL